MLSKCVGTDQPLLMFIDLSQADLGKETNNTILPPTVSHAYTFISVYCSEMNQTAEHLHQRTTITRGIFHTPGCRITDVCLLCKHFSWNINSIAYINDSCYNIRDIRFGVFWNVSHKITSNHQLLLYVLYMFNKNKNNEFCSRIALNLCDKNRLQFLCACV